VWARDFDETKAYGSATSTVRTDDQKKTAYFWNANVVNQLNTELRDAATQNGMDLVDTARLLAAGVIAVSDANMACWHSKYTYLFWRPLTAIRNADIDGNAKTEADPAWAPLVTHPNHPEWPSAHGCVSGSVTQALSELLNTNRIDVIVWGGENGAAALTTSRHFDTVDEYRDQVADARVWGGFHYRTAVKAGLKLGEKVAHWDISHAFRPVKD
jgi:Flp pilus assembly protein TadG